MIRYGGCPIPDTDKDGINDENDKCVSVAGLARYDGCPIPDSDKDGINDEEDTCPQLFGVVRYKGCPVPDKDKDGVNDEDDKCAELPGTVDNLGCPMVADALKTRVDLAAKNILFVSGTARLNAKSNAGLDDVSKILAGDKSLTLAVEAQTQELADAVRSYLVKKGISENRIRTMAHSDTNRGVALTLGYF